MYSLALSLIAQAAMATSAAILADSSLWFFDDPSPVVAPSNEEVLNTWQAAGPSSFQGVDWQVVADNSELYAMTGGGLTTNEAAPSSSTHVFGYQQIPEICVPSMVERRRYAICSADSSDRYFNQVTGTYEVRRFVALIHNVGCKRRYGQDPRQELDVWCCTSFLRDTDGNDIGTDCMATGGKSNQEEAQ